MGLGFITKGKGKLRKVIPIIKPVRLVKGSDPIEKVHVRNKRLVEQYGLKVGQILEHKTKHHRIKIVSIHPLYGWVVCEYCDNYAIGWENLDQDMRNIDNFIIQDIKTC